MALVHDVLNEQLLPADSLPPKLPDLRPIDFQPCEAMKASNYKDYVHSLHHLKDVITNFIKYICHA
jgi:hypothetical protein